MKENRTIPNTSSKGKVFVPIPILIVLSLGILIVIDLSWSVNNIKQYQFNKQGNIISRSIPGNHIIKYYYNKARQITKISYQHLGGISKWAYPFGTEVNYKYDLAGNRIGMKDQTGITEYKYDEFNRLSEIVNSIGQRISFQYNPWGNVQSVNLDGKKDFKYQYDVLNHITTINLDDQEIDYEYKGAVNQVIRHLPNRVTTITQYSPSGLLVSIKHRKDDKTLIASYRYEYDPKNRIKLIEETTSQGKNITNYEYDLVGRLCKVINPNGSTTAYTYDALGNRITQTEANQTIRYAYNAKGQLIRAGKTIFAYDARGNLVSKKSPAQHVIYQYDEENRLTQVHNNDKVIRYVYDGEGNRISREVNGKVTYYLNIQLNGMSQVAAEYDQSGMKNSYILGRSHLGYCNQNGDMIFFLEDYLGSTRDVVGNDGDILAHYNYSSFGEPTVSEGTSVTDFQYTGEQWDPDAKLFYLRARYYDPQIGRFLSTDLIQGSMLNPQTFNQYVYVNNDPINKSDPFGLYIMPPNPNQWNPYIYNPNKFIEDFSVSGSNSTYKNPLTSPSIDPINYSPWTESLQNRLDNWGINALNKYPGLISKGTVTAGTSAMGYAILEEFIKPVETNFRMLADPRYTDSHPIEKFVTGIELSNDIFSHIPTKNTKIVEKISNFLDLGSNALEFFQKLGGDEYVNQPRVGGVYLDQAAQVIGQLGTITGAAYDKENGRLILIGTQNITLTPLKPEYLAEAIRAVYTESQYEPGMTIDPLPQNPHGPVMLVRFFGNTENTHIGLIMFEADRVMKGYSVGSDNITKQPVQSKIPDYKSLTTMGLADEEYNPGVWSRFWLVPEPVVARVSKDNQVIIFDPIKMRVKTETMYWSGGKLVPAGNIQDVHAEAFAKHFTTHYEDFGRENQVYAELKQVTQAVALAKWLKQQGIPIDWNFVRIFSGQSYQTPQFTPSAYAELTKKWTQGNVIHTLRISSFGGVDMTPQLQVKTNYTANLFQKSLLKAAQQPENREKGTFAFNFNNTKYQAVTFPSSTQRDLTNYNRSESVFANYFENEPEMKSLPGLTRYYNSSHNESSEFGYSWSLLIPRLEFEKAGKKGESNYLWIEGDPATKVLVQRFILTNQFGMGEEHFTKSFIDQDLRRIAFKPDNPNSKLAGLYPESDGSYRIIFKDNTQAIFDSVGRFRALLTKTSKAIYDYDNQNRLSALRFSDSGREMMISYEYDFKNRLISSSYNLIKVTYQYEQEGNLIKVYSDDQLMDYKYNQKHLLTEVVMNGQMVVRNSYDNLGHLTKQVDPDGNQLEQIVKTTTKGKVVTIRAGSNLINRYYDEQLRLTNISDNSGNSTKYSYDQNGRLFSIIKAFPTGGQEKITISPDRKTIMVKDPRGIQTEYRYNSNGNLAELLVNNRQIASFEYNDRDHLMNVVYEGGQSEQYEYDNLGHISKYHRLSTDNEMQSTDSLNYIYDSNGTLIGFENATLGQVSIIKQPKSIAFKQGAYTLNYQYNSDYQPIQVNGPDGFNVHYSYEPNGQLNRIDISKDNDHGWIDYSKKNIILVKDLMGGKTKYTYNSAGLLVSVQDPYGELTSYYYDNKNKLRRIKLPTGRELEYSYDDKTGQLNLQQKDLYGSIHSRVFFEE